MQSGKMVLRHLRGRPAGSRRVTCVTGGRMGSCGKRRRAGRLRDGLRYQGGGGRHRRGRKPDTIPYILAGLVLLLLFGSHRIRDSIHKALTDNWQLTLLASTGIALSLASAYTTFDGLRNFTSAPLLSVFISFGIQGVMLIVAWLIGESFAVGMNQRATDGRRIRLVDASVGALLGVAFVGLVFYWTLHQTNAAEPDQYRRQGRHGPVRRRVGLLPALARAAGDARLRLPARRRHLDAVRAEPAPDRQERRAVGDVHGLHGGLGVLLLQLAFQCHLPGRVSASAPPRSAPPTRSAASSPTSAR